MLTIDQLDALVGKNVYGGSGDKIGSLGQFYLDDQTSQPEWATVQTGLFGTKESFVPLADARPHDDGIVVPYDKDKVKDAPSVDPDGHLSEAEEQRLYSYYGLTGQPAGYDTTAQGDGYDTAGTTAGVAGTTGTTGTGSDDDAMTRSEEHLRAGTETVQAGRARLRKHVVTETEQVEVPVRREELVVEREPITDANRGAADAGPTISEAEHEVVLTEERPVVETEAVPVERVRLGKETVTDTETVSGEVRKEQIDLDDDTRTTR